MKIWRRRGRSSKGRKRQGLLQKPQEIRDRKKGRDYSIATTKQDGDIKKELQKARPEVVDLHKVSRIKNITTNTRVESFNAAINTRLFYGSKPWSSTRVLKHSLQVFVNRCLRRLND